MDNEELLVDEVLRDVDEVLKVLLDVFKEVLEEVDWVLEEEEVELEELEDDDERLEVELVDKLELVLLVELVEEVLNVDKVVVEEVVGLCFNARVRWNVHGQNVDFHLFL